MKIPPGEFVGAAEGAVWVCVAAKRLTKVSFCSENLGIIWHFFGYQNAPYELKVLPGFSISVPSADVELGDFFFFPLIGSVVLVLRCTFVHWSVL